MRAHADRFSFCIHGNNHTHREFGEYSRTPFSGQVADIKQAVARMERFRALTGIAYDHFMVFPHAVAPEKTLAALADYGFVGTANSVNVPVGATYPSDPLFALRPYTVAYGGLLSLSRSSAEGQVPGIEIAIQSFLGNPLLFYAHESLFEKGANAFNAVADLVNHMRPGTRWASPGEIVRHTHLLRRRDDGMIDVRMFSSEMDLENPASRDVVFSITHQQRSGAAIRALRVNGTPIDFKRYGTTVMTHVVVPAGVVVMVRIEYEGALDTRRGDVGKTSTYALFLRLASDFRDLYLSQISWGRLLTRMYYRNGWDSIELGLEKGWLVLVPLLGLSVALGIRRRMLRKKVENLPH
jgi:hypothetical protein